MTKRDGDKVTRSGIMMTGSAVQPTITWSIVAAQMGFKRVSDDYKTAAVNPEAGKQAMQWVLDLFDKWKVSTRDVTNRYKAFGTGQGSIFWTGPWTLNGYVQQKLNFRSYAFPKIGSTLLTYLEEGGMELYVQKDTGRYEASMQAVKWLSDNSLLWTTKGRGASPRTSIQNNPALQDRGPALGSARRLRRGRLLRDAEPGRARPGGAGLRPLRRRQFPGQDSGRGVEQ